MRGRGGKGDVLHPENVATITLGLAQSHAAFAGIEGHRTIRIDEIGLARPPEQLRRPADLLPDSVAMPVIETASPRYKLFEVTNAKQLRVNPAQRIARQLDVPTPSKIYAPIARPEATGLDRGRPWRFVSLIESLRTPDARLEPGVGPGVASLGMAVAYDNLHLAGLERQSGNINGTFKLSLQTPIARRYHDATGTIAHDPSWGHTDQ